MAVQASKVAVLTLFPEMFKALTDFGVSGRASATGIVDIACFNPRDHTVDKHRNVDDKPYGGGPGMVMMMEPLLGALNAARQWMATIEPVPVVYLSPQGPQLERERVNRYASYRHLILIAGRYEGIDERFIDAEVDEECSIGDYVLSGGELPAMVLLDAMLRKIPGVLGDWQSAQQDSFEHGLLDHPQYTRPEVFADHRVPEVLLSGDHQKIKRWREKQALGRTAVRRPELMEKMHMTAAQQGLLDEYLSESK